MKKLKLTYTWDGSENVDEVYFDYFKGKNGDYKLYLKDGTRVETYWGIVFCDNFSEYSVYMYNELTKLYDILIMKN